MGDVQSNLKPLGDCEGNREKCANPDCPKEGVLLKASKDGNRRVRGCKDPVARGKANRRKGKDSQREMRRIAGVPDAKVSAALSDEEAWRHPLYLCEAKAGFQVQPVATRFLAAERQALQNKAWGDMRDWFVFLARPPQMPGGLVTVRGDVWREKVLPALEAFYGLREGL